ncbi:MAG: DUF2845 domain-containing protein [Sandaracinaceae bacterium]|nr:DUF2845 domain-containing protein [Sandaracinaceae bacterium]
MRTTRGVKAGWLAAGIGLAAAAWLGPFAGEAHALQCGQSLVLVGDSMELVRDRCGEPTTAHTRLESRIEWVVPPGPGFAGQSRTITIEVVVWTYDFGPGRFIEELEFRNGVLTRSRPIGPGGHGR